MLLVTMAAKTYYEIQMEKIYIDVDYLFTIELLGQT